MRILYVVPPSDISAELRRKGLKGLLKAIKEGGSFYSPPEYPAIFVLKPTKWLPNTLSVGKTFNRWLERRQIRKAAQKLGMNHPLLWLNPEGAVHMVGKMGESGVVYDITDDWTSAEQPEWERRRVIADDAELCRRADLTVVCSERLFEMKRGLAKNLTLIPNGVEAARYRFVSRRDPAEGCFEEAEAALPLPEMAREWRRPILGYTGTVHAERVDLPLLMALAKRLPQATFPLIGMLALTPDEQALLRPYPNIKLVGPVPYADLQAWMRAFDVCIVPHVVSPFTESLNPLKLFEYLAAGLPIVSTDVAGFRDYGPDTAQPLVSIAGGEAGKARQQAFIAAVETALAERADTEKFARMSALRQQEAARHTWQARTNRLLQEIQKAIGTS